MVPRSSDVSALSETRVQKLTRMSIFGQGVAEDRLLEHRNSRSRFLTVREKHRLKIQAAEMFRQVQAGSRSVGGCSIERLTYRRSIERRVSALYICKPKHRLIICLFSNAV